MRKILLLLVLAASLRADEYRAFWVETFRTPLATRADVDRVIDAAVRSNANALFVQVRRRGDSWYVDSEEPLSDVHAVGDPDEGGRWTFDPLRYLIDAAHAKKIQVHAYVIVGSVHNLDPTQTNGLPSDPNHVFLQHVWDAAAGAPYRDVRQWATRALPHNRGDTTFDGYRFANEWYLDLGNPEAASFTADVLLHLVRAYDIDGLHLDRIRYPDCPIDAREAANVGYNDVSVSRFKARYGNRARYYEPADVGHVVDGHTITAGDVGYPRTSDSLWSNWRREQVTEFVRRVYLSATAIKPSLNVSAALICYGAGPRANGSFAGTEAYWHVFQDWQTWARDGIIDTLTPMMYKREYVGGQRAQFDDWLAFLTRTAHDNGRFAVPGLGAFMNSIDDTLRQARRARAASANGMIFFAVGDTAPSSSGSTNSSKRPATDFFTALRTRLFESPAAPPKKAIATTGAVMGYAIGRDGARLDGSRVTIESLGSQAMRSTLSDGSGFYGMLKLEPGDYRIRVDGRRDAQVVRVQAGSVSRVDLDAPEPLVAPVASEK